MIQTPIIHTVSKRVYTNVSKAFDYAFKITGKSYSEDQSWAEQFLLDNNFRWPYSAPDIKPWQKPGNVIEIDSTWSIECVDRDVKSECIAAIDEAAEDARQRLVSFGPWTYAEYHLAGEQAQSYRDANYTGEVPCCIESHALAFNVSYQQAADEILLTKAQWEFAAGVIRENRLVGKQRVETAVTPEEQWTISQQYITILNNLFN